MSYELLWWKVVGYMAARQMTGCDLHTHTQTMAIPYAFHDECAKKNIPTMNDIFHMCSLWSNFFALSCLKYFFDILSPSVFLFDFVGLFLPVCIICFFNHSCITLTLTFLWLSAEEPLSDL